MQFKVREITLEQRPDGRCSNVILLTLNRFLFAGIVCFIIIFEKQIIREKVLGTRLIISKKFSFLINKSFFCSLSKNECICDLSETHCSIQQNNVTFPYRDCAMPFYETVSSSIHDVCTVSLSYEHLVASGVGVVCMFVRKWNMD